MRRREVFAPALGFIALIGAFWFVSRYFGVAERIGGHLLSTLFSFVLLLGPYWAFGFGCGEWLRGKLPAVTLQVLAASLLILPYAVFTVPRGVFSASLCASMLAVVLAVCVTLAHARRDEADWHDALALAMLALAVELHYFKDAWPAGLSGMGKLIFVDTALYGYLVIRPLPGIGFDLRARISDVFTGLREFVYFTPIALALGFVLGFLHAHKTLASPQWFASGWLFTLFFIAIPEELFFRGLMLNILERRIGARSALWITAIVFGLAHFNKRAPLFNWRYVILAAIAGVFYGRAWLENRRVLASSITHATVDTVWSIWLR